MSVTNPLDLAFEHERRTRCDEQSLVRQLLFVFAAHTLAAVVAASSLRIYPLMHPGYSAAMSGYAVVTYLLAVAALLGYGALAVGLWPRTPLRAKPLAQLLTWRDAQTADDPLSIGPQAAAADGEDALRQTLAAFHAQAADRRDAGNRARRRWLRLAYLALFVMVMLMVVQTALEKVIWSLA